MLLQEFKRHTNSLILILIHYKQYSFPENEVYFMLLRSFKFFLTHLINNQHLDLNTLETIKNLEAQTPKGKEEITKIQQLVSEKK